jgi:L-ascorbate metabolism protein UlaG (beta-lactamase superfamily)
MMRNQSGTFVNLDGTTPDKPWWAIAVWLLAYRLPDEIRQCVAALLDWILKRRHSVSAASVTAAIDPKLPHLTWLGHSTFLLRIADRWILIDPVFGSPSRAFWRHVPVGVPPHQLPAIDAVLLSHDHYDHLDLKSLGCLKGDPAIIAPLNVGSYLPTRYRTSELDWWQSHELFGMRITLVPAHHWSMRSLGSKNKTLWGGFVIEANGLTLCFAGDTAFKPPIFDAIRARFPRIDVAILPIGAYEPRWFMSAQHMDPEEAVASFEVLGAKRFVSMHWGTFHLSSEPRQQPAKRLLAEWTKRGLDRELLWLMAVGETKKL